MGIEAALIFATLIGQNENTHTMKTILIRLDQIISAYMDAWGLTFVKVSFAIIFVWFGVLKPLGYSSAIPLVEATVAWLPVFEPKQWVALIGWWEVAIGVLFLFRKTIRIAIALLFLQMVGTFMPMFFLPEVVYQKGNVLLPTMEGQYIIKNVMIISAALVVGGQFHRLKVAKMSDGIKPVAT